MRLYNAQVEAGLVVMAAGSFPVADHCCEVPDDQAGAVLVNHDWQVYEEQVPWPSSTGETPVAEDAGRIPADTKAQAEMPALKSRKPRR